MSFRLRIRVALLLTPLSAALAGVALSGQSEPPDAPDAAFDEAVEVRVVEVDVRVNDRKGRPVNGLTAEDFVLFDDGQVVPIEYFTVLGPREPSGTRAPARPPDEGDTIGTYTLADQPRLPHLAVYLDHLSLRPADRDRVLDDVARFVESLEGPPWMSLFTFDGGVEVPVRPTRDVAEMLRGLDAARAEMAKGYQRELDEDGAMRQIRELYELAQRGSVDRVDCRGELPRFLEPWRIYAEQQAALSRSLSAGLIEATSTLAALEGRKDLVYVSSGLARLPGLAVNEYLADLCAESEIDIRREMSGYDLSTVLQQVTAHANRSRVTIHALDAGGLRPLAGTTVRSEGAKFRLSPRASELRTANLQSGLFTVAVDTGGRAILDANQPFEALRAIREDVAQGYLLGFSPDRAPDLLTHRIRVSLVERRKDVELRYRQTYVDPREEETLIERLLAALRLGWGGNPLDAAAVVGEPERVSRDVVETVVRIAVPAASLPHPAEAVATDTAALRVRVVGVAIDSRGRRTVVRRKSLAVDPPVEGVHLFEIRLKLPPEHYRIGVSLEVEGAGRASYVVVDADLTPGREGVQNPSSAAGRGIRPRAGLLPSDTNSASVTASTSRGPRAGSGPGQPGGGAIPS